MCHHASCGLSKSRPCMYYKDWILEWQFSGVPIFPSDNVRYCSMKILWAQKSVLFTACTRKIKAFKVADSTTAKSFYPRFFTYGLLKKARKSEEKSSLAAWRHSDGHAAVSQLVLTRLKWNPIGQNNPVRGERGWTVHCSLDKGEVRTATPPPPSSHLFLLPVHSALSPNVRWASKFPTQSQASEGSLKPSC